MAKGRGYGSLTKGDKIASLSQLSPGTVILGQSHQFGDAENTYMVSRVWDDKVYIRYVNADDIRGGYVLNSNYDMCVWGFELTSENPSCSYWRAKFPKPSLAPDAGWQDLPLFSAS